MAGRGKKRQVLNASIDEILRRVDVGLKHIDELWRGMEDATTDMKREKSESAIKKEVKKMQKHRDSIRTWISGGGLKDTGRLEEAKSAIEAEMERLRAYERLSKQAGSSTSGTEDTAPDTRTRACRCGAQKLGLPCICACSTNWNLSDTNPPTDGELRIWLEAMVHRAQKRRTMLQSSYDDRCKPPDRKKFGRGAAGARAAAAAMKSRPSAALAAAQAELNTYSSFVVIVQTLSVAFNNFEVEAQDVWGIRHSLIIAVDTPLPNFPAGPESGADKKKKRSKDDSDADSSSEDDRDDYFEEEGDEDGEESNWGDEGRLGWGDVEGVELLDGVKADIEKTLEEGRVRVTEERKNKEREREKKAAEALNSSVVSSTAAVAAAAAAVAATNKALSPPSSGTSNRGQSSSPMGQSGTGRNSASPSSPRVSLQHQSGSPGSPSTLSQQVGNTHYYSSESAPVHENSPSLNRATAPYSSQKAVESHSMSPSLAQPHSAPSTGISTLTGMSVMTGNSSAVPDLFESSLNTQAVDSTSRTLNSNYLGEPARFHPPPPFPSWSDEPVRKIPHIQELATLLPNAMESVMSFLVPGPNSTLYYADEPREIQPPTALLHRFYSTLPSRTHSMAAIDLSNSGWKYSSSVTKERVWMRRSHSSILYFDRDNGEFRTRKE